MNIFQKFWGSFDVVLSRFEVVLYTRVRGEVEHIPKVLG